MNDSALSVQPGVAQPPSLNPNVRIVKRPAVVVPSDLVARLREGDPNALARSITLIESSAAKDQPAAREVIDLALPFAGNSVRVGITGVPGVGKSTFIEAFGMRVTQEAGRRLAVLAIDPTSSLSHGSILGDKSRMAKLSANPQAFIRPSPTGGSLGGVARKTREAMILCEAAGYDLIVVETVGVGQSELTVHSMVDCFLLLMLAGAGDEMQGIKRGIMEMADILAITKVDGDNVNPAKVARQRYLNALHLFPPTPSGWAPPVLLSSAMTGEGVAELWAEIERFVAHEQAQGQFAHRRANQAKAWMRETVERNLLEAFYAQPAVREQIEFLEEKVMRGEVAPRSAADALLKSAGVDVGAGGAR